MLSYKPAQAQCDISTYKNICIQKIPEYFVFSKTFPLQGKINESDVILNAQLAYIFVADSYRTLIEIYRLDANGQKTFIKSGKAYVSFIPGSTQKYKARFIFEDTDEYCGAAVLCFLR